MSKSRIDEAGNAIEYITPDEVSGLGILDEGDRIELYNEEDMLIATFKVLSEEELKKVI
jgi:hypothetical protein